MKDLGKSLMKKDLETTYLGWNPSFAIHGLDWILYSKSQKLSETQMF